MSEPVAAPETVWEGRFLKVLKQDSWEYASRSRGIEAVVILAIDAGHVILIEQFRVPLGRRCLELPAGLVGDDDAGEAVATAALRELEEETGWRAGRIEDLGFFHASPGMVTEGFTLVRAHDLARVGDGGGAGDEEIIVHRVALDNVPAFLETKRAEGAAVDVKLLLLLAGALLG